MWKNQKIVFNKKPNFEKLMEYGFTKQENHYEFSLDIVEGTFRMTVFVTDTGVTEAKVVDKETMEEYAPVYVAGTAGSFVGSVRAACEKALTDIVEKCYEADIFKSEYAKQVIQYVREKYGAEAEYLWEKFPNNAIFRELVSQKWYAAILSVEKRKVGIDEDGTIEIIDLRETPEAVEQIVDGRCYLPGYHMNKKHWYTIRLDGSVQVEEIFGRIDTSLGTIKKSKK